MPVYLILFLAVMAETIGTTALQASQQFTRLGPSVLVVVAYAVSFYLLSITLRTSSSIASRVLSPPCLCCVTWRPRNTSPSSSA